jgi:hypothetical protein
VLAYDVVAWPAACGGVVDGVVVAGVEDPAGSFTAQRVGDPAFDDGEGFAEWGQGGGVGACFESALVVVEAGEDEGWAAASVDRGFDVAGAGSEAGATGEAGLGHVAAGDEVVAQPGGAHRDCSQVRQGPKGPLVQNFAPPACLMCAYARVGEGTFRENGPFGPCPVFVQVRALRNEVPEERTLTVF